MASLELIDGLIYTRDNSGVDLYYGKFTYRTTTKFKCINWVRTITDPAQLYKSYYYETYNYMSGKLERETPLDRIIHCGGDTERLERFVVWRSQLKSDNFKLVISNNKLSIYHNSPEIVQDFIQNFGSNSILATYYRQRVQNYVKGSIYHSNPTHKWRLHLKPGKLSGNDAETFKNYIQDYCIKPSNNIGRNLHKIDYFDGILYLSYGSYLDINDEHVITILGLRYPDLVNKISRIEKKER